MQLDLEDGTIYDDPTPREVAEALASLDGDANSFAIIGRDEMEYLQASGGVGAGFRVEYQAGSLREHYRCPERISLYRATRLFQKYAVGDDTWRQDLPWEPMKLDEGVSAGRWKPSPRPSRPGRMRRGCFLPTTVLIVAALLLAWLL